MASITDLSIRRPVATCMAFLILLVLGIVSFINLPVDLLPQIEFTQLTVSTQYPNVGPEEIEQIITDPIENAIAGLPNLERVTSESSEGRSRVRLEFGRGTSIDEAANDLRAALDRVRDALPVEVEAPQIYKLDLDRTEVVSLAAMSTRPLVNLTRLLEEELARRFEQIPGVGTIEVRGGVYREIRIDLDRDRLFAANLTALDVQEVLQRENTTLPGGNVKSGFSDLYVRAVGEYASVSEIEETVLRIVDDRPVRVRDVANVRDDYEDVSYMVEVNGVPSVSLGIQKQSGANTVAVASAVRDEVARINAERNDVEMVVISDQSEFIQQSIDSVRSSALWGSLLAIVVLYGFLRNRSSTAIIAFSIPISVVASFGLLYFGNLTLNQMTFGGLALGVGLIVDNAIVVLENIVRKREQQEIDPAVAASTGTREVAGAIVASTLTTCVIFLPVVFARTTSAALFQALALVVVFALGCSLFVALTLVPMLSARFLRTRPPQEREKTRWARIQRAVVRRYAAGLEHAIEHRRTVFLVTGALLLGAVLLWPLIPVELAPQTEADEIDIDLEMARGTNIAVVRAYLEELEEKAHAALPGTEVDYFTTEVRGGNAEIELKLAPQAERELSSEELADRLRQALEGKVPGGEIRVRAGSGLWILRRIFGSGGGEEDMEIELRGWDLAEADRVAAEIRQQIETIPGITGVRLSRREGQPQENLRFDRERVAELGLSVREVARTIQANLGGVQAGRLRDAGEEVSIVVRLRPEHRLTGQDLRGISIRTASGQIVPVSTVIEPRRERGPTEISRVDGQRVLYISATLDPALALGEAVERVQAELADVQLPPGFTLFFGGEYQEQKEARRDFAVAIVMALALVYMLMAAQFERFVDPLIVMASVPMALVGVVPTLLLTGTTLNMQSVMGLVMLIGIVVNNAIVLVDTINLQRREGGMELHEATLEAGRLRLRPILMTTTTTVLGLAPLALGIGTGAEIQAALARTVIGGLVASTLVTLLLIPVTYVSVGRLVLRLSERRLRARGEATQKGGAAPA
ncbi:MAG TPA: efflux RND transporter permease subunit [Thermoanaerobaculia bacterium]|nr:efflux RND transporter permease subunit [Thermoanaerobaculia bacterium]